MQPKLIQLVEGNPFTPDRPVQPQYFAGRREEIQRLLETIKEVSRGRSKFVLIGGERGIGKTSLALFAKYLTDYENSLIPSGSKILSVYCALGACNSLSHVCTTIIQEILRNIKQRSTLDRVTNFLKKHISQIEIGAYGVASIRFNLGERELREIPQDFYPTLSDMWEGLSEQYNGLMIISDEIDKVANFPEFAPFLKSLSDSIAANLVKPLPLLLILCAIPDTEDSLVRHHESLPRLFRRVELSLMTDEECRTFVLETIKGTGVTISEDALDSIIFWSTGFPSLLQEIGYSVWEANDDTKIDDKDIVKGVVGAIEELERKHFRRRFLQQIGSNTYREILDIMASNDDDVIQYKWICNKLKKSKSKCKYPGSYLGNMVSRGIISKVRAGRRGEYQFNDRMFKLYIRLLEFRKSGSRTLR